MRARNKIITHTQFIYKFCQAFHFIMHSSDSLISVSKTYKLPVPHIKVAQKNLGTLDTLQYICEHYETIDTAYMYTKEL